jgi:nitroreductase
MQTNEELKRDILEAFNFRHATKEFDPEKKISKEDFDFILETGRLSPSSFGVEPWRFIVVQNQELRKKIKETSWGAYGKAENASHFVIFLARTASETRYDANYLREHFLNSAQIPEDFLAKFLSRIEEFQKEDFKLLDDGGRLLYEWACRQTYIALANMMTAAAQLKIDSCPIEGFNIEKMNALLEEEGLLEDGKFSISVMAAFGYRKQEPAPKKRRLKSDVIKWID